MKAGLAKNARHTAAGRRWPRLSETAGQSFVGEAAPAAALAECGMMRAHSKPPGIRSAATRRLRSPEAGRAGAWAASALSPYCAPLADHGALWSIDVPVEYQGGTRDFGVTPSVTHGGGCFDRTCAPASFVDFADAGHFAWTDLQPRYQADILAYSAAFFDAHLRGSPAPNLPRGMIADIRVK